jgi:V8-like Glu-specific endopeptidase
MRSSLQASAALLVALSLVACSSGGETEADSLEGKQTASGGDDMIPVTADGSNLPEALRVVRAATAVLDTTIDWNDGPSACTATHIGNGLVLTAGHCVARNEAYYARRTEAPEAADRPFAPAMTLHFGSPSAPAVRATVLDAEYVANRDYAILHIDAPPAAKVAVRGGARPAVGTGLTMLSYPGKRQAQGRPDLTVLMWSQDCSVASSANVESVYAPLLMHTCDGAPGSSGAGLIDAKRTELVAIENGALGDLMYSTSLDAIPLQQYLDGRSAPAITLKSVVDAGTHADKSADVTATIVSGAAVSVEFEIVQNFDDTVKALPSVKRTSAPWTAHFDTSRLSGPHDVRAIVTDASGASRVEKVTFAVFR